MYNLGYQNNNDKERILLMNKIKSILLLLLCFITLTGFTPIKSQNLESENEIFIEILIGDLTEEEINEFILDDGTYLKNYNYTIVSNPLMAPRQHDALGYFFNFAAWITRDGKLSLSLDPVYGVRIDAGLKDRAWSALSNPNTGFGGYSNFSNNYGTLNNQFSCHFWFANMKDRWNIEHWRPNVGYWPTVWAGCNPE